MKRTAEKVLSVIAVILTAIGTIMGFLVMAVFNLLRNDPTFKQQIEMDLLADPALSPADVDMVLSLLNSAGGFLWIVIILTIISIILNIIGIVNIWKDKNAKLAGIMFIIAGLLAGILSIPSILLYIAAILCFTKKQPLQDDLQFEDQSYNSDGMRSL
ncbi:DUF4064 domain-containing protein [Sporosarcina thermotolerans]|uniref:DUF4064 domain-containing protein n=1 Tax=Sporosarcina thermotolerans TaxID=633404 RepID=A0AAW9AG45_9BACL|nr:DUF4064 domain-containing protein [Sporosarcina thermotolerans]MDW0118031.1 DUF4064 domain-containing protein [Sporosarcina thermotolerans]WHT49092.1 DUF4064 domain-containing protein [Sporosarcina thermotolerans]